MHLVNEHIDFPYYNSMNVGNNTCRSTRIIGKSAHLNSEYINKSYAFQYGGNRRPGASIAAQNVNISTSISRFSACTNGFQLI